MSFNAVVAIRLTPYHARRTGWPDCLGTVFGVLGFTTRNPTAKEFVTAVHMWQLRHPPLDADGILGARTWARLRPEVEAYRGRVAPGTRPDWVDPPSPKAVRNSPAAAAPPTADAPEDRAIRALFQEWQRSADRRKGNLYLAVPVSNADAVANARLSLPSLPTPGICGTLRVGQVWQGLSGEARTVVALTVAGPRGGAGMIDFVTDSGQAYRQAVEGWDADFMAGVYAGVVRSPTPTQALLGAETQALLGAISAAGGAGFATAVGMGTTQWALRNREVIAQWVSAIPHILGTVTSLQQLAPTVLDTVFRGVLRRVLAEIPEPAADDPTRIARSVGGMLVKWGEFVLKRDAAALAGVLAPLAKPVAPATIPAAQATIHPTVSTVKAAPGAAEVVVEVTNLIRELRRSDVSLAADDAGRIVAELRTNPLEVRELIEQLRRALRALG